MNCKPGDLAIVVNAPPGARCGVGSIVRCLSLMSDKVILRLPNGGYVIGEKCVWQVEWRGAQALYGFPIGIPDRELRPIRDPGDDAKDEMLRPLPQEVAA